MQFAIVLEDDLADELCRFRRQESYDDKIIENILRYYKPPILLSFEYMEKYYDPSILSSILGTNKNIPFKESIENLAYHTTYKIILSSDKQNFPYVNINKDKIENNLTATFTKNESRTKAKEHFKQLFSVAQKIFIYDKYLTENNNWVSFIKFATECFPNKQLNIFYHQSLNIEQQQCTQLKEISPAWTIQKDRYHMEYDGLHDRYIIIDRKIQLILTSGIDYLMDDEKDFTYIIRIL